MKRVIRPYKDTDLEAVMNAWESASELAHSFLSAEFMQTERDNIPKLYMPNADTWVLEQDGEVIGFIALLGNEVGALFVQPSYHGTGAGRALMDKARELQGDLVVEVFAANMIGRRFYDKAGFVPLAEKVHEPTGQKLLVLQLSAKGVRP